MLIPSIDLYNGQAVQWRQGKERVLARDDVESLLEQFSLYGDIALIDLNAALGEGDNKALIKKLLARATQQHVKCRVGGGIRDKDTAIDYIKSGADKIILGTALREDWVKKLPREWIIGAIDAKGDQLVTKGWTHTDTATVIELLPQLSERCCEFLYTQVLKEGMMQGLDRERVQQVVKSAKIPVTIAGGISTLDDIQFLRRLGANAQIGMAVYTGALTLDDCFLAGVAFDKSTLIPTVVQDIDSKAVLMLAYSTIESLRTALTERAGVYWSRSRQQLWRKGETSGHIQQLIRVDTDCDGDSLIFQVKQTDMACHLQRWSCFNSQKLPSGLLKLDEVLAQRQQQGDASSYSAQLFADETLRNEKLREETEELIEASEVEHVRWEAADLLYFALINARAKGVSLADIESELRARHK